MSAKIRILFVDDEEPIRSLFCKAMEKSPVLVQTACDGEEALGKLESFPADIVITDVVMPKMDGHSLLKQIKLQYPSIFVIVITGKGSVEDAVESMKTGAYDYVMKPFDFNRIQNLIEKIAGHKKLLQNNFLPGEVNIVGQDPKMFEIFRRINQVAKTDATVLIVGETGTGKELIAEAIHHRSPRRKGPLAKVNCAALTETIINSELFGHEKGAFTGAVTQKKGHFENADGGTIFLDEIGDIPLWTQISLLRILETGTFQRVGGTKTLEVNTRFICATNKDLSKAVSEKVFREDLYYRINVVSIQVPPLRERKSDIPLLANHFLKKYSSATGKDLYAISKAAMELLIRYNWPGNVRELTNVIENAVIFSNGREITSDVLPKEMIEAPQSKEFTLTLPSKSLPLAESTLIRKVLEETSWNLKQAAKDLNIARGTLYSKMKKYGIERL